MYFYYDNLLKVVLAGDGRGECAELTEIELEGVSY